MTENEENKTVESDFMNSKFWRTFLTVVAVFLIFAGPTYVIYALAVLLKINLWASFATGFALFVVGLLLVRYLAQKKVIV